MGTLERIRQVGPYALGAFAVVFIGFMVLADANIGEMLQSGNNPQTAVVAKLGDEELLYTQLEKDVQAQAEQQRSQATDDTEVDYVSVRRNVWQTNTDAMFVRQAARQFGLIISDETVADLMLTNPPSYLKQAFTDSSGNFNQAAYLQLVTNPSTIVNMMYQNPAEVPAETKNEAISSFRNDLILMERYMKLQKYEQNVTSAVNAASSIISPAYAREKFLNDNVSSDVLFVKWDANMISDADVSVSDQELKDYYNKNKQYYRQKEGRKFKYLTFAIQASAQDSAKANRKVQSLIQELGKAESIEQKASIFDVNFAELNGTTTDYTLVNEVDATKFTFLENLQIGEIAGPIKLYDGTYFLKLDDKREGANETVKAAHILINFDDNKDSAKAEAENILKMAKSGESFADLATKYSKDPGSANNGGDLGFFGKGMMVPEFEEAAFSTPIGEISNIVESQFGFHIIKVEDKQSVELKFSEIKITPSLGGTTKQQIKRNAITFAKKLEEGANFEKLAEELGMTPVETSFLERERGVMGSTYITDFLYNNKLGAVLNPLELKTYGFITGQLSAVRNQGIATYEEVQDDVRRAVTKSKKVDLLMERAKDYYSKANNVLNLRDLTVTGAPEVLSANGVSNNGSIPGVGRDYIFTAKASIAPLNKVTEPIRGEIGVYVMQVIKRNQPSDSELTEGTKSMLEGLSAQQKQSAYYTWFADYKKRSKFEDNRFKLYTEY